MKTISTRCVRFVSGLREVCASFCVRSSSIYRLRARRSLPPKGFESPEGLSPAQRASRYLKGFRYALLVFLFLASFYASADAQQKMYWSDDALAKIQRADLDGSNKEDLINTGVRGPQGIALDVPNNKMYWTDVETAKIQRANLDGSNIEDLITTGLVGPYGIALDLANSKMYWG